MLGIEVEGILRTNGNSKLLERLRSTYNRTSRGDIEAADAVTVGGLLKVFLRELPDGLIRQEFTAQFVNAQDSEFHTSCILISEKYIESELCLFCDREMGL